MTDPLRVPVRFRDSLRALDRLSEEEFAGIVDFLDQQEEILPAGELAKQLAERFSVLGNAAEGIVSAAVSLDTRAQHDNDACVQSAEAVSLDPSLELDEARRSTFADRLMALLQAKPIRLAAKSLDLVTDYDHVYYGARILTDIRPVFDDSDSEIFPAAAVVIANLKIEHYGPSGQLTSFHVALDHWDLEELRGVVERGLEKTESSKKYLEGVKMAYLRDTEVTDDADS